MTPNLSDLKFSMNGYEVYADPNLLVIQEEYVELTWSARLFSWPWRPWQSTYKIKLTIADPKVYKYGNCFVAHPYTVTKMSQEIIDRINYTGPDL